MRKGAERTDDYFRLAASFRPAAARLADGLVRPFAFAGSVDVHSSARAIHCFATDGSVNNANGSCTYSFIGRFFIGANTVAPGTANNSARDDSLSRANTCEPNVPANMWPFTNAAVCPNIGRTVTRGSSGRSARNSVAVAGSVFGIVGRVAMDGSLLVGQQAWSLSPRSDARGALPVILDRPPRGPG